MVVRFVGGEWRGKKQCSGQLTIICSHVQYYQSYIIRLATNTFEVLDSCFLQGFIYRGAEWTWNKRFGKRRLILPLILLTLILANHFNMTKKVRLISKENLRVKKIHFLCPKPLNETFVLYQVSPKKCLVMYWSTFL